VGRRGFAIEVCCRAIQPSQTRRFRNPESEEGQLKATKKATTRPLGVEQQLKGLIARLDPKRQALIRSVRRALRKRLPSENELVYDYSKYLVIGYSPTERGSDAVIAISSGADGLRLYFNQGPTLPDPKKILLGSGKQTRFIWIESPRTLKLPEVESLLESAIARAKASSGPNERGTLIIKSNSAKRRPGRKSTR